MLDRDVFEKELRESGISYKYPLRVVDFEEYQGEIQQRAEKWAIWQALSFSEEVWYKLVSSEFLLEAFARSCFNQEKDLFRTNKPFAHEALFPKTVMALFVIEARERGYIKDYIAYSAKTIAYLKVQGLNDDQLVYHPPTFGKATSLENKDKELFPDPEPIRVEVAGAIINFTIWDAALVAYVDSVYKGEEVQLEVKNSHLGLYLLKEKLKAVQVIERQTERGKICAAIFPRIPLVIDWFRHTKEDIKRMDGTVKLGNLSENVTLFRKHATELDWRGR